MKRKSGFTLVELLVVIGIIALLISILLPALGRVRYAANMTACSARLRDVTMSIIMYANDNKGSLPPGYGDNKGLDTYDVTTAAGNEVSAFYTVGNNSVSTFAKNDPGSALGRLLRTKYITTPKVFICPTQTRGPANMDDQTSYSRVFSFYCYNPHVKYVDAAATIRQFWWKKVTGFGKVGIGQVYNTGTFPNSTPWRRAIVMDSTYADSFTEGRSHKLGQRRGYNMGYLDGSVSSYQSDRFTNRAVGGSTTDNNGTNITTMLDITGALQAAADGQAIDWRGGGWQNKQFNAIPIQPKY